MNVLVLSPCPDRLCSILEAAGDRTVVHSGVIGPDLANPKAFDFAVSYRYRHIIRSDAVSHWQDRIVNLHISLLPWNRGADPNFWSVVDGTPSGVSIHYIDAGIDTGDLIAQEAVPFAPDDTLASSYERLNERILCLFAVIWPALRTGSAPRFPQPEGGSYHRSREKDALVAKLPLGWNTPISEVSRLLREDSFHERDTIVR